MNRFKNRVEKLYLRHALITQLGTLKIKYSKEKKLKSKLWSTRMTGTTKRTKEGP
jgi:hypothetical protein